MNKSEWAKILEDQGILDYSEIRPKGEKLSSGNTGIGDLIKPYLDIADSIQVGHTRYGPHVEMPSDEEIMKALKGKRESLKKLMESVPGHSSNEMPFGWHTFQDQYPPIGLKVVGWSVMSFPLFIRYEGEDVWQIDKHTTRKYSSEEIKILFTHWSSIPNPVIDITPTTVIGE